MVIRFRASLTIFILGTTIFKFTIACYVFPADTRNPCLDRKCSFGAVCVSSLDGLSARCQCPDKCYNLGDNEGGHPICGTDGMDYINSCELRKKSCRDMKDIVKKYNGKCDPCKEALCNDNQVCKLDGSRNAVCQCGNVCSYKFNPVCANNGRTYKNKCLMDLEGCRIGRKIFIVHLGNCSRENACLKNKCDFYAECHINTSSNHECVCPELCDKIIKPVCGSDGITYDNICEMRKNSCILQSWIMLLKPGLCENQLDVLRPSSPINLCSNKQCLFGRECEMVDGRIVCKCRICSLEASDPVCGSDGTTYRNECEVTRKSCITNNTITVQHFGLCGSCQCNVVGSLNAQCDFEDHQCHCKPGVSGSRCDRCESTYWGFSNIVKDHYDGCIECNCSDFGSLRRDCEQSTGNCDCKPGFFGQHCQLCQNKNIINNTCAANNVEIKDNGCKFCNLGGDCGECACPVDCKNNEDEVCGSDGVTYFSMCHLEHAACKLQNDIILLHRGKCNYEGLFQNSLNLDGRSFYEFKKTIKDRRKTYIKMSLKTTLSDALVFLEMGSFDFISIGLNNGKLKVIFNLGKDVSHALPSVDSQFKINDNMWHSVGVERKGRMLELRVDRETPHIVYSMAGAVNFNSKGLFFLGGSNKFIKGFPNSFLNKFKGCIRDLYIDTNDFIFGIYNSTLNLSLC